MRLLAVLAALSGAACMASTPRTAFETSGLDGEWRIVTLNARPIDGSMRLEAGRITVSFGCNSGSGAFRIAQGRLLPLKGLAVTEMACHPADLTAPDLMALETEGFRIVSQPMWIAGTRENRRLRLWNEQGWLLAEFAPRRP